MRRRARAGTGLTGLLFAAALAACGGESSPSAADATRDALETMGTPEALSQAGPFAIHATGTLDKAAEGQGLTPGEPSTGRLRETVAVDPAGVAVAWRYHEERYDGTSERFGEAYPSDSLHVLLLPGFGVAIPFRGADYEAERASLRQRLPHEILASLADRPERLEPLGTSGGRHVVSGPLGSETETTVTVTIDPEDDLVREMSYRATLPGRGPATVRWRFDDYREVAPGVLLPFSYGSAVGDLEYTDMAVDSVSFGGPELFEPDAELRRLPVRDAPGETPVEPLEIREIGPGLHLVQAVRSGFNPLVVEFDTFLVAVDAPASFPILGRLPADETDPASTMSAPSERLVDALASRWPDKPISHVILTHHHEDHVGGVRAFVAAGATVLGPPNAIDVARGLSELAPSVIDDRLAATPVPFEGEAVTEVRDIGDGSRTLRIVPVGENPHADGMLVIHLPGSDMLYVSDLLTPEPVDAYPGEEHAALDRFFAGWLRRAGLAPAEIWTMHGQGPVTPEHLARLR